MIKKGDVFLLAKTWLYVVVSEKRLAGETVYELLSLEGEKAGELVLTLESRLMKADQWMKLFS